MNRDMRRDWWRTLEERAGDPAFREYLHNEFPSMLPEPDAIVETAEELYAVL